MTTYRDGASGRNVLISGGGISGLTLAYWLNQQGLRPTIVERAPGPRPEGYAIDFGGSGWDVAERMGILPALLEAQTIVPALLFKDSAGTTLARMPMEVFRRAFEGKMLQTMRPDLETILYESVRDTVPVRFGTTIQHIAQEPDKITATLSDGSQHAYDMIVGADGAHSHVRRLIFGDESQFDKYLGYYFATFPAPNLDHFEEGAIIYHEPNRQATIFPDHHGGYMALLVFREKDPGHGVVKQAKPMLEAHYQGAGWVIPKLIASITAETPIFFDSVTQIQMPRWTEGRVTLVGDAAHCLTLVSGQGASTAMGGAYILAEELSKTADYATAFKAYEGRVRPFAEDKQRKAANFAKTFVPGSDLGVWLSQLTMRLMFTPLLARFLGKQFGFDSLLRGR